MGAGLGDICWDFSWVARTLLNAKGAAPGNAKALRDGDGRNAVELRDMFLEVRLAERGDAALIGLLAVAAVNLFHHVEAAGDFAERREAHLIELRVVAGVDEKLRGARAGASGGERNRAGFVGLGDGIVGEPLIAPRAGDGGIGVQTELHDEAGDDAEEMRVVEVAVLREIVEPVGAERSPR